MQMKCVQCSFQKYPYPPQKGLEFPGGWVVESELPQNSKKCMRPNWNILVFGRYGYFVFGTTQ